jgi:GNAT superfamily N-acetyltransferase
MQVAITRARSRADIEAVRGLFEQYAASLPFDLGYQDFPAELAGLPAPYVAPEGALLLARCGRTVIGIVGLRRLRAGIAEIKRLYVVPGARGSGVGRALLEDIFDAAQRLGYLQVRLDSHRASMTTAIALYRRLGFAEIPPYGPDLGGQIAFFEKALRAGPADQEGTMAESITLPRQ